MDLATGAMGALLPKLVELLQEEYKLQTGVRKDVEFLEREMRSMDAALRKVGMVRRDQLDEQVKIWAGEVRELSYEMEDVVDSYMVRVEGSEPAVNPDSFKGLMHKMANLFKKGETRHQIADAIKEIKEQVKEVAARRDRYKVDDAGASANATTTVDPRILALFKDQRDLVGIKEPRDELIKRLTDEDDGVSPNPKQQKLKILSIFGFGGLGKTTLAKAVYDNLQEGFVRRAFVSVGQNPNLRKVFMDILLQLDKYSCSTATVPLDEVQLIGKLQELLRNERYLIVIDDIWDEKSWEIIRCALVDSKCGSRVIITTRILSVAQVADYVYNQEPLSVDRSKELFNTRLSTCENSHDQSVEISEKILQKCGGVPLAIITIASLLAGKPREDWPEVYNSVGFGHEDKDNMHVDNTRKILLYSYYDLPCHIRTCLLYLSIYPEDREIQKDTLIWKWIAEGFIHEKSGMKLFELGEKYFNELINRSMIQPVERSSHGNIYACRVHDLVLDMISSLSKEENFAVVLSSNEQDKCPQSNARRLAMQSRVIDENDPVAGTLMPQVRSFNAIMCHLNVMPRLSSFQGLRVLDLEGCIFKKDHPSHLEDLGKLRQLRYLGLSNLPITELPEEIGNLKLLQTLYLDGTYIEELPQSFGLLRQLRCLHLWSTSASDRIGGLTSLEELSLSGVSQVDFMEELGKLTELRVLTIKLRVSAAKVLKDLTKSLGNLQKLQAIRITLNLDSYAKWHNCKGYLPSRHLRYLDLTGFYFHGLPPWIDSSRLPHLAQLSLVVDVEARDVEILGRFPDLVSLRLRISRDVFPDVVGGGAFPKLRHFFTSGLPRFLEGAMPRLEDLDYFVGRWACDENLQALERAFASLRNLPCLKKLGVYISSRSDTNLEEAEDALRHAVKLHPNDPTLALKSDLLG